MISFVGIFFHENRDWDIVCEMEVKIILHSGEKTTDLSQVTDKLYHLMLYTLPSAEVEPTSVAIGTDCICSCKIQLTYDHSHNRQKLFCILNL
jgi:hypothetical protein